jgi:hypothetical protein
MDIFHPIQTKHNICNESYLFNQCMLEVYNPIIYKCIIDDTLLDANAKYLIQFANTGNFGYYSVGKLLHIFENQTEIEQDIYHYYFMQFSA